MKQTHEEYANELIEKYRKIQFMAIDEFIPNSTPVLISCAIIDIENTIEALKKFYSILYDPLILDNGSTLDFYNEVLTILKNKL
jgi:hypothetical protein